MKIKCQHCGATEGFYQNKEVEGVGWSDAQFFAEDDGSISVEVGVKIEEIQWDGGRAFGAEYGCSLCGAEKSSFLDLVVIENDEGEEIKDPILYAQKHPIPGQMTID